MLSLSLRRQAANLKRDIEHRRAALLSPPASRRAERVTYRFLYGALSATKSDIGDRNLNLRRAESALISH